jgi:predicted nucleic acid-binding protein
LTVFVDTSALFALIAANDPFHVDAGKAFAQLIDDQVDMVTSNYVLVETTALVQSRIGMDAVRVLENDIRPSMQVVWIDRELHELGWAALIAENRRQLSLVDLTSFAIMHQRGIDAAFTFDEHFAEQGFTVV